MELVRNLENFREAFDDELFVSSPSISERLKSGRIARSFRNKTTKESSPIPKKSNELFAALPREVKAQLEPACKLVSMKNEEFLYQEDDHLDYIYFPITAVISEFKILEDGRMVEIAVTGNEGSVGLSTILAESDVVANCTQVSQPGTALRVSADVLTKLIHTNDAVRNELSRFVASYIKQISQKAICNMYHSVKERLCTWLLMLEDRCGSTTLKLTHEQIARTLGVYRPSVTCIAQELRTDRLIDYSRGGISIRDREKVKSSACTCYMELNYSNIA